MSVAGSDEDVVASSGDDESVIKSSRYVKMRHDCEPVNFRMFDTILDNGVRG